MRHLEFRRKHGELILEGKKRVTFRKRTTAKPGDIVYVHSGGKIIGKAKIVAVERKRIEEITDEDAKLDGFESREELLNEMQELYSDRNYLYMVKFDFEPIEAQNPYNLHYRDADLVEVAKKALKKFSIEGEERKVLETFIRTGSIRRTALKLGGWKKRGLVRKVLRKYLKMLREAGEDVTGRC